MPPVDNYELGQGFEGEFQYRDALISFNRAAAGRDPAFAQDSFAGLPLFSAWIQEPEEAQDGAAGGNTG